MLYLFEVGIGATRFGIRRTFFSMGSVGTVESSVEFEIEGGCTRLAETLPEEELSDTRFATGLLFWSWYVILGDLLLNISNTFADAVTSSRKMQPWLARAGYLTSWRNLILGELSRWLKWHREQNLSSCIITAMYFQGTPPFRVGMPWRMIVLGFGEVAGQGVHYEES